MSVPPAPALDCSVCGKTIAKRRVHYLLTGHQLVCIRCLATHGLHETLFPDCTTPSHDAYDHIEGNATRAGAAHVLGLWP